jgi:hypothetical protein
VARGKYSNLRGDDVYDLEDIGYEAGPATATYGSDD